jgi:adenylate cyclase class 2
MAKPDSTREIEIKLALPNAAEGRRLLRAAGFKLAKRRVFEANTLFDTVDGALGRAGTLLRVRRAGSHGLLTYKGPAAIGKYKDREELEVEVADPARLEQMLAHVLFRPMLRYEKYRAEYKRPGESGVATLDETPIGAYLELEGAPAWIDRSARRLGFREDSYILASYLALYADYCRLRGKQPSNMTFK